MKSEKLRIGYIPLVDAAALVVAVDMGFAAAEGLSIDLVREVSWSNVRDKLNIGLFDAAHLLSPVAIASSLGIGHVRVPIIAPFILGVNGNAITVSPRLFGEMSRIVEGNIADPLASGRALARVVADRKARNAEPLTFGMTFPLSNHNYQLRFWMAAGGVDPDDDVRLVVLPPRYMVESLAGGLVDGFCVGAPWNSVAVDSGVGRILHFGCEIVARATEKVLALRESWALDRPEITSALVRSLARAGEFSEEDGNRDAVAAALARRFDVPAELVGRALAGQLKVAPNGMIRNDNRYILISREGAGRPDPTQAAWLYAQMVRWGQAPLSTEMRNAAQSVFRADLYDHAVGGSQTHRTEGPADGVGAFVGDPFDPSDISGHLAAGRIKRPLRTRLSVVR